MNNPIVLIIVLLVSALSITGLVLLNARLGGWSPARIDSAEAAGAELEGDVIGFEAGRGAVSADGLGALVEERGGSRLGLVLARGDRLVTRALNPGEILAVTREGESVTLHLADFTLPRAVLIFGDETIAGDWADRAARLTSETRRDGKPA